MKIYVSKKVNKRISENVNEKIFGGKSLNFPQDFYNWEKSKIFLRYILEVHIKMQSIMNEGRGGEGEMIN